MKASQLAAMLLALPNDPDVTVFDAFGFINVPKLIPVNPEHGWRYYDEGTYIITMDADAEQARKDSMPERHKDNAGN